MFIGIQAALVLVGLFFMARGRFDVGGREVGNPIASLVGIVLIAQLPLALLIGIVLALTDGPAAPAMTIPTRAGEPVAVKTVAAASSADGNWWIDPLVTCGAVLLAAGMTAIALQTEEENQDVFAELQPTDHVGPAAP
jgi:hypothetical protein